MKILLPGFLFFCLQISSFLLKAQIAPAIEWEKCLGGIFNELSYSVEQTFDGGYIVAGNSESNNGDVSGNHGSDVWVVKLDGGGSLLWQKCLGGYSGYSVAYSIQQTTDSGFILTGLSTAHGGDVIGNHPGTDGDCWVVKLDEEGNLVWQKCLGGSIVDAGKSIQQVSDGGYILAGYSWSNSGDVSGNHGGSDCWIVKLDSAGEIIWQKCLGGSSNDKAYSVQQTFNGGYIVAGTSESNDGDVSGNHLTYDNYYEDSVPSIDYWIVNLDSNGNIIWQKSLGGSGIDEAFSILQTTDGGFIVAGYTYSNDGDVTGNHLTVYGTPSEDYWIVKLDSNGNVVWQKCLGGNTTELAYSIEQTTDGGYVVAGGGGSYDGDVTGCHGGGDYWIVKLDSEGILIWQKCFGGGATEMASSIQQTNDGGYIVVGWSPLSDGDVTGNHYGEDYWVVKLTPEIPTGTVAAATNLISLYPNPVEDQLTINLIFPVTEATIHVYDLNGRVMLLPTTFTNTEATLKTEKLPDGFYTIQIIDNKSGESYVGKFAKGK